MRYNNGISYKIIKTISTSSQGRKTLQIAKFKVELMRIILINSVRENIWLPWEFRTIFVIRNS